MHRDAPRKRHLLEVASHLLPGQIRKLVGSGSQRLRILKAQSHSCESHAECLLTKSFKERSIATHNEAKQALATFQRPNIRAGERPPLNTRVAGAVS